MSKIKLSTGDYPRQEYADQDVMEATLRAFQGFTGVKEEAGAPFDTGMAFEASCALAALMVEALPGVATPRDMRVMSEEAGARVLHYMKIYRETYEATGRRALLAFGATEVPSSGTAH